MSPPLSVDAPVTGFSGTLYVTAKGELVSKLGGASYVGLSATPLNAPIVGIAAY